MQTLNNKSTGDTLTADEWNEVPSEIQNAITSAGIPLSALDLRQLVQAISNYAATGAFYADAGFANDYILDQHLTFEPITEYLDGMRFSFFATNVNTLTACTIDINGVGERGLFREPGTATVPDVGDVDGFMEIQYDGGTDSFGITSNKIVKNADIADNAITLSKMANNSVDTNELVADAVTLAKMASNSVDTDQLVSLSVDTAELNTDAVTQAKMADNSVGNAQMLSNAIDTAELQDDAVTQSKINDGAVANFKLADKAVDANKLADRVQVLFTVNGTWNRPPDAAFIQTNGNNWDYD